MDKSIEIVNSLVSDIETIFHFYDLAIAHQKKVFNKHWQGFDQGMVETEIAENRQFKIMVNGQIGCIFALTFNDPIIWGDKDKDPSIYIHRIVTHPDFRGLGFVNIIINWAKEYIKQNKKQYIRMDTWGDNPKLIEYYVSCGFKLADIIQLNDTPGLPAHYSAISLALFEL